MSAIPARLHATARSALGAVGLEVRRVRPPRPAAAPAPPPPLLDDPWEALHRRRGGGQAAFRCPLELTRLPNGFGFGAHGWHPMVATLEEHRDRGVDRYEDSVLRTYFERWRPSDAIGAIAGFDVVDANGLTDLPSHLFYLQPWVAHDPTEMDRRVRSWHADDGSEQGSTAAHSIETDGFARHGPVSDALGRLEFRRIVAIHDRLRRDGFDRTHGDVGCKILKRGSDVRFLLQGGGFHRTAAMRALGHDHVPARFPVNQPDLVDVDDVELWPQVRSGVWSRRDALRYVDHLFDFDDGAWAAQHVLGDVRPATGPS